jgi:hypothetical protein
MSDDNLIDVSFEVRFQVKAEVRNINDSVIDEAKVVDAAKAAAFAELARQTNESVRTGDFDIASE